MRLDRLHEILGTGRLETAAGGRSAQPGQQRRDRAFVQAKHHSKQKEHQGVRIEARFARRNHSSSSAR